MKICVIGAGRWGKNHVRTLHAMGVLGGVVERHAELSKQLKQDYPDVFIHTSLEEPSALEYDGYTVATPAEFHYDIAKLLIEKGKHVLVEKPITLNTKEAKDLNKLAEDNNVVLMTGHLLLFHPAIKKIKELLTEGKIGKLQYMYSNRLNLGTVRTEENSLWNFAPHDISIFQYLTESFPTTITSKGGAFLQPKIHDTTMTVLEYPDNRVGHIFVSWLHPFKEHRIVVIGSKGMLSYEDSSKEKELLFYEKGIDWVNGEPIKREGATEVISFQDAQPLTSEMQHFIDCINGDDQNTKIGGDKGLEVLDILETAQKDLEASIARDTQKKNENDYFAHPTCIIDKTASIGEGTKIWQYSSVQKNASIGKGCIFGQSVNVGNNVKIGNKCKIQNNVSVYEGVELEDFVFCGPSMVFTNINAPRSKYPQAESKYYLKTLVKEGTSIGANATIVCGTTLGRFSFVGAGSVVTKDVPDFGLVVGNPARLIGWVSEGGKRLDIAEDKTDYCEKSGKTYTLKDGKAVECD